METLEALCILNKQKEGNEMCVQLCVCSVSERSFTPPVQPRSSTVFVRGNKEASS